MTVFDDDPVHTHTGHRIGQDLSALSVHELDERIVMLKNEIARLEAAREGKETSVSLAHSFFKLNP